MLKKFLVKFFMEPDIEMETGNVEGSFIDLDCQDNTRYQKTISSRNSVWLIWTEKRDWITPVRLNSDVVLGLENRSLYEVIPRYSETGMKTLLSPAGTCLEGELQLNNLKGRFNLRGTQLRGVFLPMNFEYDEKNLEAQIEDRWYLPENLGVERSGYVLVSKLAYYYNFRIDIIAADTWGILLANGSFNGMIGLLERSQADIGTCPCEMRPERFPVVTFLPHQQNLRLMFLFLEERVVGTYKALLLPFSLVVWLCILILVALAAATFLLLDRTHKDGLSLGFVLVVGIISQQGLTVFSKKLSEKIYSTSLLFFGLILSAYYNVSIMNGLLSPAPTSIHNIRELERSSITPSLANVVYLNFDYNQRKYISPNYLMRIKQLPVWLVPLEEGLQRVRREHFALAAADFQIFSVAEKMFSDSEKCIMREIDVLRAFPLAITIQKNSPYKEMLTQGILRLQETGHSFRERGRWYPQKPKCLGTATFIHVSMKAVSLAVGLLCVGLSTSMFILAIEITTSRLSSRKQRI